MRLIRLVRPDLLKRQEPGCPPSSDMHVWCYKGFVSYRVLCRCKAQIEETTAQRIHFFGQQVILFALCAFFPVHSHVQSGHILVVLCKVIFQSSFFCFVYSDLYLWNSLHTVRGPCFFLLCNTNVKVRCKRQGQLLHRVIVLK
jgi:hypothetical protein